VSFSFGSQEPGTESEIVSFCSNTYGVSFPIMAKIDVNGDAEHPVYKFLKSQKSGVLGLKRIKVRRRKQRKRKAETEEKGGGDRTDVD